MSRVDTTKFHAPKFIALKCNTFSWWIIPLEQASVVEEMTFSQAELPTGVWWPVLEAIINNIMFADGGSFNSEPELGQTGVRHFDQMSGKCIGFCLHTLVV